MSNPTLTQAHWNSVETKPPIGERVRVKHELGTYGTGQTTGVWDGEGWATSEFFIDPHTLRLYRVPTHWASLASPPTKEA